MSTLFLRLMLVISFVRTLSSAAANVVTIFEWGGDETIFDWNNNFLLHVSMLREQRLFITL